MPKKGELKKGFSKTNLAREYRDKFGMKIPTNALAKIMYNENKLTFSNSEDARAYLRAKLQVL